MSSNNQSCNSNNSKDNEDEFEWDESQKTKTAWSLATRQRSKRITYGRRSTSTGALNLQLKHTAASNNSGSGCGTLNAHHGGGKKASRMFARQQRQQQQQQQQQQHQESSSSSFGLSSTSMNSITSATAAPSNSQSSYSYFHSSSKRSISLSSFGEIACSNEENRHPNIIHESSFPEKTTSRANSNTSSLSASLSSSVARFNDSLTFSTNSFSSICHNNRSNNNNMFSSFNSHNNSDEGSNNNNSNNNTDSGFIVPCLTPSRSVSSSSRKRGVCESPLLHCDDLSSSGGGLSATNLLSTSSFGSRRARSRIFSPESTKKIMAAATAAAAKEHNGLDKGGSCRSRSLSSGSSNSNKSCLDRNDQPEGNSNNSHDHDHDKNNHSKTKRERMMALRKKNESFNESESEMEIDVDDNDNSFSFHNTSCELSQIDLEENEKSDRRDNDKNRNYVNDDWENNHMNRKQKKKAIILPVMPRRMSSVGNMSFEDAIFAPVESNKMERGGDNDVFTSDDIFDNMSSYEDLKFLIKELRRWSSGKLHASFGMNKNCTVVPPNSWSSTRRSAFVEWSKNRLGFCHKCCGGSVSYLQTSESKAKQLQKDLEKALLEYKEGSRSKNNENKFCLSGGKKNKNVFTPLPMSTIKISKQE